jgi:hypothetical protein
MLMRNADPDPAYHFDADPDPTGTFQFDSDPDPQHNNRTYSAGVLVLTFLT